MLHVNQKIENPMTKARKHDAVLMQFSFFIKPEKRGRKPGISLNGDRMVESMGGSHRHI